MLAAAASSRFRVPPAFVSKSSNGIGGREIVRGLRGGMDDEVGFELPDQRAAARAVANVQFVMGETKSVSWSRCWFQRVSPCGPKKHRALVVVHARERRSRAAQNRAQLRTGSNPLEPGINNFFSWAMPGLGLDDRLPAGQAQSL